MRVAVSPARRNSRAHPASCRPGGGDSSSGNTRGRATPSAHTLRPGRCKRQRCTPWLKQISTIVSAVDDGVNSPSEFDPRFSSHSEHRNGAANQAEPQRLGANLVGLPARKSTARPTVVDFPSPFRGPCLERVSTITRFYQPSHSPQWLRGRKTRPDPQEIAFVIYQKMSRGGAAVIYIQCHRTVA